MRKKKKRKPGRVKTGIPRPKRPLVTMFRRYLPFIVMAAAAALILLFLYAQSRNREPRKLKMEDLIQHRAPTDGRQSGNQACC